MTHRHFRVNRDWALLAGVAVVAVTASTAPALAQAPSNEQLYQMLLELKAGQERLKAENVATKAENERIRKELLETKRKLAIAEHAAGRTPAALASPASPAGPPPKPDESASGAPAVRGPDPYSRAATDGAYASLPAVSALNFKGEGAGLFTNDGRAVSGVRANSAFGGYGSGSLTFPLGARFWRVDRRGVGLDGFKSFPVAAGHLFWRDPSTALVGVYGSLAYADQPANPFTKFDDVYAKLGLSRNSISAAPASKCSAAGRRAAL